MTKRLQKAFELHNKTEKAWKKFSKSEEILQEANEALFLHLKKLNQKEFEAYIKHYDEIN